MILSVNCIPPGAYEIESLDNEIKQSFIDKGYFTESNYPFTRKWNSPALGSIADISSNITGSLIVFIRNDSKRDLLGYKPVVLHEAYNLSDYPVDNLSFDNILLETDMSQGMSFRNKKKGIIHNCTMRVDPGYKYIEKFAGGISWYMMDTKDFISTINFKIKNENNELLSFNGETITFIE